MWEKEEEERIQKKRDEVFKAKMIREEEDRKREKEEEKEREKKQMEEEERAVLMQLDEIITKIKEEKREKERELLQEQERKIRATWKRRENRTQVMAVKEWTKVEQQTEKRATREDKVDKRSREEDDAWWWKKPHDNYINALLADLQNTITPSQSATSPSPAHHHNGHNMYRQERVEEVRTEQRVSDGGPKSSALNNNLSELDTLLEDLNHARYSGFKEPVTNGAVNGSRPSVDSLLDELNSVDTNNHEVVEHHTVHKEFTTTHQTLPSRAPPPQVTPVPVAVSRPAAPSQASASSATKELDDLMASLSDFKVMKVTEGSPGVDDVSVPVPVPPLTINASSLQTQVDSAYARPQKPTKSPSPPAPVPSSASPVKESTPTPIPKEPTPSPTPPPANQLDSMLGSLASHMTEQGVTTTQKGCCTACDKPIVGQVITALGKTWHPEHFTCTHCNQELGTKNFFERDGRPYCEQDYHDLFSPRCAYCNGPILDKCVTALDKTWHPKHFFCTQCGNTFGDEGFHERDGKPYCREDYYNMFAPKCGGCNSPIMENYISALNAQWHPECFVCRDCRQPFNGGSFFDHEGMPYCETHYHAKRGSLCAGCSKPITGRCITAMFRKYHPEHFVCSFCLKQLNKGTFKEQNDKPYCHACFDKLFG
ncbi:paxillin-like isoform X5 [Portunus trituberculatus]|uniref:paxillin-like isoform X5 n=1 Tax=Portunus trituberculatus TaxID=210409 RepID=UPI001E1CDD78|nr:paxillin-like isoform X5 [Portunus trituberculatus]